MDRANPYLAGLYLDRNQFNGADAAVLADALSGNTHLRNIWIDKNEIKEDGRLAFLRVIFDVSSLSSCAASNHTFGVHGLERDISVINHKQLRICLRKQMEQDICDARII